MITLWPLLPPAAYSGWLAAIRQFKQRKQKDNKLRANM